MARLWFCFALFLVRQASAACIDDLRELADVSLAFQEATRVKGTEQRSTEGSAFNVYFDKADEQLTVEPVQEPNNKDSGVAVVAIRAEIYGETFRAHERIAFLNQSDYVVRAITENYEGHISFPRGGEILSVESEDYFFCANTLQVPKHVAGGEQEAKYKADAENMRALFFEASELKPYIRRIKP